MKILICENGQYGYSNYFYYVKYLSKVYQVDYFCLDARRERISFDGDQIFIYKRHRSVVGCLKQIIHSLRFIKQRDPEVVIVRYFRYCLFIGLLCKRPAILDIRTVDVNPKKHLRMMHNLLIRMTALFYQHRITIKSDIAKELKIMRNVSIVPLGADFRQDRIEQNLDRMKLLYVGTLDHRRIHETIEGLSHFCRSHPDTDVVYTIIGDGKKRYENLLVNQIKLVPTNLTVNYVGYVPTTELDSFYQSHNIGVSYVPIIDAYMPQPVTKTFEYLLAGMIVIGTALPFHNEVITKDNGVITQDNPDSFAEGIYHIYKNLTSYDLKEIQARSLQFSWDNVVNNALIPAIEKACKPNAY